MLTSKKDHWSQTKRQDNAVSNGSFPLLHTKIGLYSKGSKGQSVGEVNITSIMCRRQNHASIHGSERVQAAT